MQQVRMYQHAIIHFENKKIGCSLNFSVDRQPHPAYPVNNEAQCWELTWSIADELLRQHRGERFTQTPSLEPREGTT